MDTKKIGNLIYQLRCEHKLTQLQLADQLHISDKTVSKWERGAGCPDVSLWSELSKLFGVDLEQLLSGGLDANEHTGGNMKKMKFYVCEHCGNIITAMSDAMISCCGKKMQTIEPQPASKDTCLSIEIMDSAFFISGDHPMEKDHFISFVALLTHDTLTLRKLYPQMGLQVHIPFQSHGELFWYCTQHGLFYQNI